MLFAMVILVGGASLVGSRTSFTNLVDGVRLPLAPLLYPQINILTIQKKFCIFNLIGEASRMAPSIPHAKRLLIELFCFDFI